MEITPKDVAMINEVLEYVRDDRERHDFIDNCDPDEKYFDDEGDLICRAVPLEFRTHIYWKACYLWERLP